jgi:hypothetical protein
MPRILVPGWTSIITGSHASSAARLQGTYVRGHVITTQMKGLMRSLAFETRM